MKESKLELNVGDVYYSKEFPYHGFEVLPQKHGYWYLAYLKGDCSKITYIPHCKEAEFHNNWFKTCGEAEQAKLEHMEREVAKMRETVKDMKKFREERGMK